MAKRRTYSELRRLGTFMERYEYLKLAGEVGTATFGFDRWVNQMFYRSSEWRRARRDVIVRDEGCDLGVPGHELHGRVLVHHINPMTEVDVANGAEWLIDPEFLITTTHDTHNAIHYGDSSLLPRPHVDRRPGDTRLW